MRKGMMLFFFSVICILAFSGCESKNTKKKTEKDDYPIPQITTYTDKKREADVKYEKYYYAVDEKTGVVYIVYENQHQYAMTPALNTDGTPVTKNQLLEEKENQDK